MSAGVVQGMVTGMRGLCNGLGPAMFGVIFYLFHVDLNDEHNSLSNLEHAGSGGAGNETLPSQDLAAYSNIFPGPPFAFGALMVVVAIIVAAFIPEGGPIDLNRRASGEKVNLKKSYI